MLKCSISQTWEGKTGQHPSCYLSSSSSSRRLSGSYQKWICRLVTWSTDPQSKTECRRLSTTLCRYRGQVPTLSLRSQGSRTHQCKFAERQKSVMPEYNRRWKWPITSIWERHKPQPKAAIQQTHLNKSRVPKPKDSKRRIQWCKEPISRWFDMIQ